jgi:RNA polymerase sigma factor (sigma-70 family)
VARALSDLVHHLGRVASREGLAHLADGELLRRFAADRDPLAFEALVWRHGAMVLGVCGRVLGRGGDADDAFQATFLVLVRHARAVRSGESLAGWLYRVARRVSVRAARGRVLRAGRERLAARPEAVFADEAEWSDWRAFLDREVERLPARYRDAFILCHIEGRAHEDAARELGCPLGTLHSRLARAKERLRTRLAAVGAALPAAAGVASARLVTATVAAAVELADGSVVATSPAAVALSQGVWKPMSMIKTKFVLAAALAVAAAGSGVGLLGEPTATATPTPVIPVRGEPTVEELKRENERLRREVATLKARLGEIERRVGDDAPSDQEVLRAMPRVPRDIPYAFETFRDDITIVKTKILDRLDPPRVYPTVGTARLRRQHWECTVYYTETVQGDYPFPVKLKKQRVQVVYIDKDTLVLGNGGAK